MRGKAFVIGLFMMSLASGVYGKSIIDETSIVPIHYENKAFIRGQYQVFQESGFQVYSQEETVYLPLRLVTELLNRTEEDWEVDWSASKPNEAYLRCQYMEAIGEGGSVTTGEDPLVIHLSIGSTRATVGTKEVHLSKAPKKIAGAMCLPLRSIGELLGKTVTYQDGLVILSEQDLPKEDELFNSHLKAVKTRLEKVGQQVADSDWAEQLTNVDGISYYTMCHYEGDQTTYRLYGQKNGESPQCLKEINEYTYINGCFQEGKFYYIEANQLHALDLKTKEDKVVLTEALSGFINRLWLEEGTLYLVSHEGDWTMGSESLFKVVAGKAEELASCHQFGSIILEGDTIYYTTMDNLISSPNLFKVTQGTTTAVGAADYIYDMGIEVKDSGIGAYWLQNKAFILEGKLYGLGYANEATKGTAVYAIDLTNHTQEQVTDLTTQFWRVDQRLYYIETETQYLKVVDLKSGLSKVLIERPIKEAKLQGNTVYYTVKDKGSELGENLYSYGFDTGTTLLISGKPIKAFEVGEQAVIYVAQGYEPGIYKWQNHTNSLLESRLTDQVIFGERSLWYNLKEAKGSFTIAY